MNRTYKSRSINKIDLKRSQERNTETACIGKKILISLLYISKKKIFLDLLQIKPCSYQGDCDITVDTRRSCCYCRLKKCLDCGMKADMILGMSHRPLSQLVLISDINQGVIISDIRVLFSTWVIVSARYQQHYRLKPTRFFVLHFKRVSQ